MFNTNLAFENWVKKYQYGNETPIETFERVAKTLASLEKNPELWEKKFFRTLVKLEDDKPIGLKCTTGGRITANVGTNFKNATLINCFVSGPVKSANINYIRELKNGIENLVEIQTPDTPDDLINIFLTILEQAKTLASEGGYGINFSFIRPRGSFIKGTGIRHPGVVSYMDIWNSVAECIVKGDNDGYLDTLKNYLSEERSNRIVDIVKKQTRKGAMLGTLNIWHPDIEEFIKAKQESGKLTKFNISVLVDDKFMNAVINNDFYDLHFDGKVYKRIKAKKLYDLIMKSTYDRAEPGILFFDNIKKNNPIQYVGDCNSTNPCQPSWANVLTPDGIRKIEDINVGDRIWSQEGWTTVIRKQKNGIKDVYKFSTTTNIFYGTKNHKVFSNGEKIEVGNAKYLDVLSGIDDKINIDPQDVMDGLVIGDGSIYFDSEIKDFIFKCRPGIGEKAYEIRTRIHHSELVQLPYRRVPERYVRDKNKICGFLRGLYSAKGSVCGNRITLKSSSKGLIEDVQLMLNSIGIISYYTTNKKSKVKFTNGEYECKESYVLNISVDRDIFIEKIGFIQKYKNSKIDCKTKKIKRKRNYDIKSIDYVSTEMVYDLTVDNNSHTYWTQGCNVSNCGEVPGNPLTTTTCLLGSINLTQYVSKKQDKIEFDFEKYKEDVAIFTRMLDNVNDLTSYPLPAYEWTIKNFRQFGMGINGLGSTLIMLGIKYGSKESLEFVTKIQQIKENTTWQTSALLAKEKGSFPLYNEEEFTSTEYFNSDRITEETKRMIRKYGVRNAKTTTNPPLGNSSIICDNVSNGIEPIFSLEYERKVICDWPDGLNKDNVKKLLKKFSQNDYVYWEGFFKDKKYYYEPHNRGLCEIHVIRDYGYQWLVDNDLLNYNKESIVTVKDLEIEDHISIQEVVQYYCNQSVSKTLNVPKSFSFSKFKNLYVDAWRRGLNGFTTYRDGSMESVMNSLENAKKKKEIVQKDIKLPETFINGPTKTIKREGAKFYIHFSYLYDDNNMEYPVAMWIHTNAKKETIACNKACKSLMKLALELGIDQKIVDNTWDKCLGDYPHNRLARMISLCLRHNIPRENILVSLTNIEGDNISSLLTAVRKFLGETIIDGSELIGMECSDCKGTLVMESGCFKCQDCGNSKCG